MGYSHLKKPKGCIFDNGTPLTKEHVWPRWLAKYIPRTEKNYIHYSAEKHGALWGTRETLRGGDLRSKTVKCVCKSCNSGWMGSIVENAKPTILLLLDGFRDPIDEEQQLHLATWAALFLMVHEFDGFAPVTSTQADRDYMRLSLTPPPDNWKIWFGSLEEKTRPEHWARYAGLFPNDIAKPTQVNIPRTSPQRANTQTATFSVGKLYVHLFSSSNRALVSHYEIRPTRLAECVRKIWPPSGDTLTPPPQALSTGDASVLAHSLDARVRGFWRRAPS